MWRMGSKSRAGMAPWPVTALVAALLVALVGLVVAAASGSAESRPAERGKAAPAVTLEVVSRAGGCRIVAKVKRAPRRSKLLIENRRPPRKGWRTALKKRVTKGSSTTRLDCLPVAAGADPPVLRARLKRSGRTLARSNRVKQPDTTAPETTIDSGPDGTVTGAAASFTFSASEPGASFECSLDSAPFAACTSPQAYAGLADGAHDFRVRATDAAGNTDATPATRSWTVDTATPETTIDSGPTGTVTTDVASFTFGASEPGASFECSLDSAPFTACTSPRAYSGLADGAHDFRVRAIDAGGNPDPTPATRSWTIDTTAPETTIGSGPTGTVTTDAASFTFSASEPGASFECSLDSAPFAACTSPRAYSGLADGAHDFRVRATDAAGNTDPTPATRSWTIDMSWADPGRLNAGSFHTCAIGSNDALACWGLNDNGQASPPAGSFESVSAGAAHTCAIRSNGTVACWGLDDEGQATPPSGTFKSLSAGNAHNCAIRSDDTVACWGRDLAGQATPPAGAFKSVSAGHYHTCGIRANDTVACWGDDYRGQATPPAGAFKEVSAGDQHTCAIGSHDSLACWGLHDNGQASPPAGTFQSVSAGTEHTCAIRSDDAVVCWGLNGDGEASPPAGSFVAVSAGTYHTCGIRSTGAIDCWGRDYFGQASPSAGTFKSVAAGGGQTCTIASNDTVACWGDDFYDQASPPSGAFQSLSAGGLHTCGIRSNDALACWGFDDEGQASPPSGSFESVSAGGDHTCAVRSDDTLACWGLDTDGQATPPAGTFKAVSAGGDHTCAIRSNDTLACWGLDTDGQASPPAGAFTSVSAGARHTCAVGSARVWCWGYYARQPLATG